VAKAGLALESAYPYTAVTGICQNATKNTISKVIPVNYKVVNAATAVTYVTENSVTALQTALNAKPIIVYVDAATWSNYGSGIFSDCHRSIQLDHAVVAVG